MTDKISKHDNILEFIPLIHENINYRSALIIFQWPPKAWPIIKKLQNILNQKTSSKRCDGSHAPE